MNRHSRVMRSTLTSLLCLAAVACTPDNDAMSMPRPSDIEKLEAVVARHPCIGSLDQWERTYRFGMSKRLFWPASNHPNFDVIDFHFRHTGTIVIAAERKLIPAGQQDWPDSASIRSIEGSFAIPSGRLTVGRCQRATVESS